VNANLPDDDIDRLTNATCYAPGGTVSSDEKFAYDEVGNRTSKITGGVTLNYSYSNNCNRLTAWAITQTNLGAYIYVSGSANEPVGTNSRFGQLWVSNPTAVTPFVDGTNFWVYDLPVNLGSQNLVAAIRDMAGNTTYITNTVTLSIVTNGNYAYSDAGCVTNIGYAGAGFSQNIGLSWNSQYQLTAVSTNGVAAERNGFDAVGRRVWNWDGTTTNYMVYGGVHVLAEVDSTGGLKRAYTHGPGIDNWLAMTVYTGATVKSYFYLTDHLGSVHAVADDTGNIVESYRYDAWGRVLGVYDGNNNPLTQSAIGNKILWQGREYSWATGLYFFRTRWYEPVTGRWLSNDSIGISGGLNQYEFCGSNPVNFVDPFGWYLSPWHIVQTLVGEILHGRVLSAPFVAFESAWTDVGTQGTSPDQTHIHAMAGKKRGCGGDEYETRAEAKAGTKEYVQEQMDAYKKAHKWWIPWSGASYLGNAYHATEDSSAGGHEYQPYQGGFPGVGHLLWDAIPMPSSFTGAYGVRNGGGLAP
jgi:RHS repeat-associated protein